MQTAAVPKIGVGAVITNERGEVLLVLRKRPPEQGTWSIPGGKLELYERLEACAVREIREEVGLDVEIDRLLCTAETIRPESEEHWISAIYTVRIKGGTAEIREPDAIGGLGWFALDSLPEPIACFAQPALDAVRSLPATAFSTSQNAK